MLRASHALSHFILVTPRVVNKGRLLLPSFLFLRHRLPHSQTQQGLGVGFSSWASPCGPDFAFLLPVSLGYIWSGRFTGLVHESREHRDLLEFQCHLIKHLVNSAMREVLVVERSLVTFEICSDFLSASPSPAPPLPPAAFSSSPFSFRAPQSPRTPHLQGSSEQGGREVRGSCHDCPEEAHSAAQ